MRRSQWVSSCQITSQSRAKLGALGEKFSNSQAAYLQRPDAQAISYGSKRNDSGRCLMLFKQRMPDPPFQVLGVEPLAIGARRIEVLALVRSLKLHEV